MEELVHRVQLALQKIKRGLDAEMLQRMGNRITGPQMFMLYYINERGRCKLSQLADKMDVKPSAITVMIDRLEKSGFVKRTHDTVDRRSVFVELTPEGVDILNAALGARNDSIRTRLSRLAPEDVQAVTVLLEKMADDEPSTLRIGREN